MNFEDQFSSAAHSGASPPDTVQGFNADDYKEDIGVEAFSPEEIEILKSLWNIMTIFVDIGWGVDGVQQLLPDLFEGCPREFLPANPACDSKEEETRTKEKQKGREDE